MHPVGLLLQHPELYVLHTTIAVIATCEIALAFVDLPECFVGQYGDTRDSGACSLGIAVGFISLVVGLVLWAAAVIVITSPRYELPVSFFSRSALISGVIFLLWLMCSLVVTINFGKVCSTHKGSCSTISGYEVATWMVAVCWASTVVWSVSFVYSVWRRWKVLRDMDKNGNTMELATFRSNQESDSDFEPIERRAIIRSGYLQMRKVPVESSKPAQLWVKRYVVLTEGKITTFATSDKMPTTKGEEVVLVSSARVFEQSNGPHTTEGTWTLEIPARKERLDFIVLEEPEMEQPNLSPDAQLFSGREDPFERRFLWLRAFAASLPCCVFGVPIGLAVARNKKGLEIPEPVAVSVAWLDTHALDEQGLYRVPGSKQDVDSMIAMYNRGQVVTIPEQFFGGNVASVLVQFLKRLPSPLFTVQLAPLFERAAGEGNVNMLKLLLSKLPRPHFCTLRAIIQHLARVAEFSALNEMTSSNLAMCVFSSMASTADALISNCEFVFSQPEPTLECECGESHLTTCALSPFHPQSRLDRALSVSRLRDCGSGHVGSQHLDARNGERESAQKKESLKDNQKETRVVDESRERMLSSSRTARTSGIREDRDSMQRLKNRVWEDENVLKGRTSTRREDRVPGQREETIRTHRQEDSKSGFDRPYERPAHIHSLELARPQAASDTDDLRQQLADIERTNRELRLAVEEQRRAQEREAAKRVRQIVEQKRTELQIRNQLQQMVARDQRQQAQHDARVAKLEAELAQLQRKGRI